MAEIDLFHYRRALGFLHFMDTRIKLLTVLLFTIIIFNSKYISLVLITIFAVTIFIIEYRQSKTISPASFIKKTGIFLLFLIAIIFIRGLTIEGTSIPYLPFFSFEGLQSGAIYSWRLFIILITGQLLISTTEPSLIHGAIYIILKPLPFFPAGQIATMTSLTITFIPLLFDQYKEVQNASHSRLGNRAKNPITKIKSIVLPLLQTTIIGADEIAQAMESRCYNENPTLPNMKIKKTDLFSLISILILLTIIILLNSLC